MADEPDLSRLYRTLNELTGFHSDKFDYVIKLFFSNELSEDWIEVKNTIKVIESQDSQRDMQQRFNSCVDYWYLVDYMPPEKQHVFSAKMNDLSLILYEPFIQRQVAESLASLRSSNYILATEFFVYLGNSLYRYAVLIDILAPPHGTILRLDELIDLLESYISHIKQMDTSPEAMQALQMMSIGMLQRLNAYTQIYERPSLSDHVQAVIGVDSLHIVDVLISGLKALAFLTFSIKQTIEKTLL